MSFYRTFIVAVAALGTAVTVFAADENQDAVKQNATEIAAISSSTDMTASSAEQKTVDINKATEKELMEVKGMTAAKAKAIMQYRKKHGDFKSLDDLKKVKGFKKMNEKTMKDMQSQLTIG